MKSVPYQAYFCQELNFLLFPANLWEYFLQAKSRIIWEEINTYPSWMLLMSLIGKYKLRKFL